MDRERVAAYPGGAGKPARADQGYTTQYAGDGTAESGFHQGYYGWTYLQASPVAAPLATARTAVKDDPRR